MMKKIRLGAVLCLLMAFLLVGCKDKTPITADAFAETMEENDLTVADVSEDYAEESYIESVIVAQSDDGWQIEFYVLEDDNYAQAVFNENESIFEASKGGSSAESSVSAANYARYALTSGGVYMCVSKIANTVMYTRFDSGYKGTVSDLMDELGY